MKTVNPLYVLGVLLVLATYMAVTTYKTKALLAPTINSAVVAQAAGEEIAAIKFRWEDQKSTMGKINSVASHPSINKTKVSVLEEKKGAVTIEAKGLDFMEFDLFCDKILSQTIPLKGLSFTRIGDYNASAKMEIGK